MKSILTLLTVLILVPLSAKAVRISYRYDAAGRMTAANYDGASRTVYGYDKNGSLVSRVNSVTPDDAPPTHLAGVYNGLVTHGAPEAANSGVITLTVLANGSFSGKFTVGGVTCSFNGRFAADGSLDFITLKSKPPFTGLDLTLDLLAAVPRITGTVSANGFNSMVWTEQALFNSKTNPLPAGLIGKYTSWFEPTEDGAGIPQGYGYGLANVKKTGTINLTGRLADNTSFTHSSLVIGDGTWPLFVPLYKKAGLIASQVRFGTNPGVSDFSGEVAWQKPVTSGSFHAGDFVTELDFLGARYTPPASGQRALWLVDGTDHLTFTASGGGLSVNPYERLITLNTKNKLLIPAHASALKLSLTPSSGLFTGSFKDNGKTRSVAGVILQSLNRGAGFIAGGSESGVVELVPEP